MISILAILKKTSVSYLPLAVLVAGAFFLSGCAEASMTNPPRSATEQLLLSTAADRAIATASLPLFSGKKVFLDATYYDSYDSKYVLGAIRDALSRAGALLYNSESNCDLIIEARSGADSIDSSESLVGIPQTGVPIPLAGTIAIPEIALYKSTRQYSIAKLALFAYSPATHEHYFSSGPMVGKAYNKYYKFLGIIQWTGTDIPEKQ